MPNKFYITTAIDYTNGEPHIGHIFEKIIADVFARYYRSRDYDVFFLTGSDEHGFKMQKVAEERGIDPQELVDEIVESFRGMKEKLNLSWDRFIRTTDEDHIRVVQGIWNRCFNKGDIYLKKYEGYYCPGCESFKKPSDLVEGKCPEHDREPEKVNEENWFFRLDNYKKQIKELIEGGVLKITPSYRKNEILNVLDEIEDFSISRPKAKLSWGIEVPNDNSHVMYVWFDALTNYISGVGAFSNDEMFNRYWPADIHDIGKNITRFHAIYWPAMLLSAGLEPPKEILAHGFINISGKKIGKSLGNVIGIDELTSRYGIDPLRYFLVREVPTTEDSDFSWEKFDARYESDLANALGNLVSRVTNIAEKNEVGFVDMGSPEIDISKEIAERRLDKALEKIWEVVHDANKYVDDEKPWSIKDDQKKLSEVINKLLNDIKSIGEALAPFMPETSEKILSVFKGEKIVKSEPLFPKQK